MLVTAKEFNQQFCEAFLIYYNCASQPITFNWKKGYVTFDENISYYSWTIPTANHI